MAVGEIPGVVVTPMIPNFPFFFDAKLVKTGEVVRVMERPNKTYMRYVDMAGWESINPSEFIELAGTRSQQQFKR